MSELEFTSGPWFDWETDEWLVDPKELLACSGDLRLIAAAPDLHEALSDVLEQIDSEAIPVGLGLRIDAALSKARGQSPRIGGEG